MKLEYGDGVSREVGNKDINVKDHGRVIRFLKGKNDHPRKSWK